MRLEIGSQATFIGKILELKRKIGKKSGKPYGEASIVDLSGRFDLLLFEKQLSALDQLDISLPLAFKCKVEEQEEVARLRLLEIQTLEAIKQTKIIKARYKSTEEQEQDTEPIDILRDFNATTCLFDQKHTPLSLILDTSVSPDLFVRIKEEAKRHKGNRALCVIFNEKGKRLKFTTALKVNTAIKENFKSFEWLDA